MTKLSSRQVLSLLRQKVLLSQGRERQAATSRPRSSSPEDILLSVLIEAYLLGLEHGARRHVRPSQIAEDLLDYRIQVFAREVAAAERTKRRARA